MVRLMIWAGDRATWQGADDVWTSPAFFLQTRKGDSEEHALVLCNMFLGMGLDAYVCVGVTRCGMQHTWVMTREADGAVVFWETAMGRSYRLPQRWFGRPDEHFETLRKVCSHWPRPVRIVMSMRMGPSYGFIFAQLKLSPRFSFGVCFLDSV
jgi:hypothetical protein